jgi:hypothetical protein
LNSTNITWKGAWPEGNYFSLVPDEVFTVRRVTHLAQDFTTSYFVTPSFDHFLRASDEEELCRIEVNVLQLQARFFSKECRLQREKARIFSEAYPKRLERVRWSCMELLALESFFNDPTAVSDDASFQQAWG